MNIVVLVKLVPDLVEELEIDPSGVALDTTFMRKIISEPDEHALEQALLLKESLGATVTVIGPDVEGMDDVLFTAAAKGADRLIKLTGNFEGGANNHAMARAFASVMAEFEPDMILTGVQAHDDMDGTLGSLVAKHLDLPQIGYISGVSVSGGECIVRKEYAGGLIGEIAASLPVVLRIQAAEQPPRYVAVSKVRQAMKTIALEALAAPELDHSGAAAVERMYQPEGGEHAEMIEGDIDQVADRFVELMRDAGVL
jgi:electron transfer flavoprotein beta subunit